MFLSKFDFISPEINLFYKGNERHSSIASGILSIFLLILIIVLIIYLSIDVIKKLNPTSFYFNKYIEDIASYPLNSSSILHYIALYDVNNNQISIDTKAINVIGVSINDGVFTEDNDISKYSLWFYELCEEKDLGNFKKDYNEKNLYNFYNSLCISKYYDLTNNNLIDKNNDKFIYPTLIHGASQSDNFEYGVYIQICQNHSIINNNNCYSTNEINNFLEKIIGYEIYFIDHSIDVENYKNPIINSIHRITSEINSNSFVLNHLNFHPIVIRTNDGLLFDNLKEDNSYNFDINEKITHINSNKGILGTFNFWMQNTIDTYDRSYKKIQDIAGGVDGIIEILMLIAKFINQIFIHDFKLLNDFNYEYDKIFNHKNKGFYIGNKKKKIQHIISNNAISNINDNDIPNNSKSLTKRNVFLTNSNNDNFYTSRKIEITNFKRKKKNKDNKFNWFQYILFAFKIKKNIDMEFLKDKREIHISEEKLLEISIFYEQFKKDYNNNNDNERLETNNGEDYYNNTIYTNPSPLVLNK